MNRASRVPSPPPVSSPVVFPEDWSGFGPRMLGLRLRERKFVWAYLLNSVHLKESGAQSARDAGYSDKSEGCKVRAFELLHREDVQEAIHEVSARELRGLVPLAVQALARMVGSPNHPEHRKATEMILNRAGLGEQSRVDVHVSGAVEHINRTDAALDALEFMQGLGVPRERQLEQFGFSGLARYEKMLSERQGKTKALAAPVAVIDADFSEVSQRTTPDEVANG